LSKELRDPGDLTGRYILLLLLIALVVIRRHRAATARLSESARNGILRSCSDARRTRDREIAASTGVSEHERVREYIVGRLRELGTNPKSRP